MKHGSSRAQRGDRRTDRSERVSAAVTWRRQSAESSADEIHHAGWTHVGANLDRIQGATGFGFAKAERPKRAKRLPAGID
jgi:hypothetical protein